MSREASESTSLWVGGPSMEEEILYERTMVVFRYRVIGIALSNKGENNAHMERMIGMDYTSKRGVDVVTQGGLQECRMAMGASLLSKVPAHR